MKYNYIIKRRLPVNIRFTFKTSKYFTDKLNDNKHDIFKRKNDIKNNSNTYTKEVFEINTEKNALQEQIEKRNMMYIEEKRNLLQNNNKSESLDNQKASIDSISNTVKSKIADKIIPAILNKKRNNKHYNKDNNDLEVVDSDINSLSEKKFVLENKNIFDFGDNQLAKDLIQNKKLDFNDLKDRIKQTNVNNNITTNDTLSRNKEELLEIDLGNIYSAEIISNLIDKNDIKIDKNDMSYKYKIKLVGKEIKDDDELLINKKIRSRDKNLSNGDSDSLLNQLGSYKLNEKEKEQNRSHNEDDNKGRLCNINIENEHFINPVIFKDSEKSSNSGNSIVFEVNEDNSILKTILSNPLLLLLLFGFSYYVYPKIWNKKDYSNLSLHRNNIKILRIYDSHYLDNDDCSFKNKELYDYINYRRGLYVNVRSNFN